MVNIPSDVKELRPNAGAEGGANLPRGAMQVNANAIGQASFTAKYGRTKAKTK